jgi:hypothetical protein
MDSNEDSKYSNFDSAFSNTPATTPSEGSGKRRSICLLWKRKQRTSSVWMNLQTTPKRRGG